jgi:signal transduction histidine kinase
MEQKPTRAATRNAEGYVADLTRRSSTLLVELAGRSLWFVRLRWWVPVAIIVAIAGPWVFDYGFSIRPLFWIALFILFYNIILYRLSLKLKIAVPYNEKQIWRFTYWQLSLDYVSMFLLIHFTGGAASPLIFFLFFHVIFASILLPTNAAFGFSTFAAGGLIVVAVSEYLGWLPHHPIYFQGKAINLAIEPAHMAVELIFFTAAIYIVAASVTKIMLANKKKVIEIADITEEVTLLLGRFDSLNRVTEAILTSKKLENVLKIATSELTLVMNVIAVSVKLLDEDGKHLKFASLYGLSDKHARDTVIEVDKSPLNKRIVDGEDYVTGELTNIEAFQFGEDLRRADIHSVLFVPLKVDSRIIGILGAYCSDRDRFGYREIDFFKQAAGLVAIALDNARTYEAVEKLLAERTWFMNRMAHNLRAPLAATLSMLEVLRRNFLGELKPEQKEYLRRVDRRVRTMMTMINELMTIASSRNEDVSASFVPVDINLLADRVRRTFGDLAREKRLSFALTAKMDLPEIWGDLSILEQMMENLISNAIKYTPAQGYVTVSFDLDETNQIIIIVSDSGIGIPERDRDRLFSEFFRAENAKSVEDIGTGLGLVIVKEAVDLHGGTIKVQSSQSSGTVFTVRIPTVKKDND